MKYFALFLGLAICSLGCVTTSADQNASHGNDPKHGTAITWHQGGVNAAFEQAKQQNKPVFLYWGAVWCPPCNELKSQIFTKKRFAELMKSAIPVYLDGDSDNAQIWGEYFNASGYPTILILDSNKRELTRISESLTMDEFEVAYRAAMANTLPFAKVLEKAATTPALMNSQEWRMLAYFSWYKAKGLDLKSERTIGLRMKAANSIPRELADERALLVAKLLETVINLDNQEMPVLKQIRARASDYAAAILGQDSSIVAARSTILYAGPKIVNWLYPNTPSKQKLLRQKWLQAAAKIKSNGELSTDTRLWASYPQVQFFLQQQPKASHFPSTIVTSVRKATAQADREAKSDFERQAVISGAAYLLRQVKEYDRAKDMLLAETKRSASPHYYFSSLAKLEKERGNLKAALQYSAKARTLAKGQSTRLQWIVSDMKIVVQSKNMAQAKLVSEEFYDTLFQHRDAFAGRSLRSTTRMAELLAAGPAKDPELNKMLSDYSYRCRLLKNQDKLRCQQHFSTVLKGGGIAKR